MIVPALNESAHIDACLRSIRAQQLDLELELELEVVVADGRSSDRTADIARDAGAIVVDNPRRSTPAGLNIALAAVTSDVVLRFDAHSEMPSGYVEACLDVLDEEERSGAVNVGGWLHCQADTAWQRAIAAALGSRFGIGNPRLWRRPRRVDVRHDVDSVPFGCWRAETLRAAGGWDESFVRNQDYELNHRLRAHGGRIVFDPSIWSVYVPRSSPGQLARQFWDYGRFRGRMLSRDVTSVHPRHLAPVALLAALVSATIPSPLARLARRTIAVYALLLAGVAVRSGGGWRTIPVLSTMHVAWGAGVLYGLAQAREGRTRLVDLAMR